MLMEARNADLDENIEPTELRASTKQRKVADRLKDPIVDKTQKRKTKTKPHGRGLQADLVNSAELGLNVGGKGSPRGVVGEKRGGERMLGPSIQ